MRNGMEVQNVRKIRQRVQKEAKVQAARQKDRQGVTWVRLSEHSRGRKKVKEQVDSIKGPADRAAQKRAQEKKRYESDPEYRERKERAASDRLKDPLKREQNLKRIKQRKASPSVREANLKYSHERYNNPVMREKILARKKTEIGRSSKQRRKPKA